MATTNNLVYYIARLSASPPNREAKFAWLDESLQFVDQAYRVQYGGLESRPHQRHTFVHHSNRPIPRFGSTMKFVQDLLDKAKEEKSRAVLVLAGWDGLVTNSTSFVRMFDRCTLDPDCKCLIRVFAENPRRFFDVNVVQACGLLDGTLDWNAAGYDDSTKLFCHNMLEIASSKRKISEATKQLLEISFHRNSHPGFITTYKYECQDPECGERFRLTSHLRGHLHKHHPELVSADGTQPKNECEHCGHDFVRKDVWRKHVRTCKSNPDRQPSQQFARPNRITKRDGKKNVVANLPSFSDNGAQHYEMLSPPVIKKLPRLDPEHPVIYRGERYCRFEGCTYYRAFSDPSKLRVHYNGVHQLVYPRHTCGQLSQYMLQQHEDCIQWMTTYAVFGEKIAGKAPPEPLGW